MSDIVTYITRTSPRLTGGNFPVSSPSYEVVTCAGAPIRTFADRIKALRFAKANADVFPGLRVEEVERIEHRRSVWRHRKTEVEPLARQIERCVFSEQWSREAVNPDISKVERT